MTCIDTNIDEMLVSEVSIIFLGEMITSGSRLRNVHFGEAIFKSILLNDNSSV